MKKRYQRLLTGLLLAGASCVAWSQSSPDCATASDGDYIVSRAFFNYGSVTRAYNTKHRVNATLGQPVVGAYFTSTEQGAYGFWSRYLLPPAAPLVRATEGDLEDRVQVSWLPDPLSPASASFQVYRDGALLATVGGQVRSFIDFNVLPGKFYNYEVSGTNVFGEGGRGTALGFLHPNGSMTGQVRTQSNNPVPGVVVTLEPTLGHAVRFDGEGMAFAAYRPEFPREEFTLSCWVKLEDGNDRAAIFDFGSTLSKNWWLHTLPAGTGKGIRFGLGNGPGDVTELAHVFPVDEADAWHYVAASYNGAALLLYVDGVLAETAVAGVSADSTQLFLGRKADGTGAYHGKLDELRFFSRQLSQTEIQALMHTTVGSDAAGLTGYWKFDEGIGQKAFDRSPLRTPLYYCGADWTDDKPQVVNSGLTDPAGYYKIEGVNYGSGQIFTAEPAKVSHFNQSLEFNGVNGDYADLTGFALSDSATVTLTVQAFDFSQEQALLSKSDSSGNPQFLLYLDGGELALRIGGITESLGALGAGFHHLGFTLQKAGGSLQLLYYKDGAFADEKTYAATDWGGLPWKLGAQSDGAGNHQDYFTGLIDEVAFFDRALSPEKIQAYALTGTEVAAPSLRSYFNLNEGSGDLLRDMGTALTGQGTRRGARWCHVAAITQVLPHEFAPATRLVTLHPGNSGVDQIDFTDQQLVPVSGHVRFEGTACFQKKVEILVNGQSWVPQVFTDETGYFEVDFEPGTQVVLSPKSEGHSFYPAFWELPVISAPVSGILFRNQTRRKVVGQVAGGHCRESILPAGAVAKVRVATLDGCFERESTLTEGDGTFILEDLPPDSVTIALTWHSNPLIFNFFQNQGGFVADLGPAGDTVYFRYVAPPQVELSSLDTNVCGQAMYNMADTGELTVRVFETYDGGRCYLDTAMLTIDNELADQAQFDTLMTTGSLTHRFRVGAPNILSPFRKRIQVTAQAAYEQATALTDAVVLGRRPRQATFASTSPSLPTLILRDPPGDGSYAFLEAGSTTCQTWSYQAAFGENASNEVKLSLGADLTTSVGLGAEVELEIDATADFTIAGSSSFTNLTSQESQTCWTTTQTISTGSDPYVVGSAMGGDIYVGGAMNFIFGITDELLFDTANCGYLLDKGLFVFPDGFATTFLYSERIIREIVIPNLLTIQDTASAQRWQAIIDHNTTLKSQAIFEKNLSFDNTVTYQETSTSELSRTVAHEWQLEFSNAFTEEFGLTINGIGLSAGITMGLSASQSASTGNTATQSRTVSYVLADDDGLDNFTLHVKKDLAYGTPVFDLVSGQSVCPWEPGTQPREEVQLSVDQNVAVNVPKNDLAIFQVTLGNTAPSGDVGFYILELVPESNPDGLTVFANGVPLGGSNPPVYQVPPFGSVDITLAVARGPVAYDYENLRIALRSGCEFERAVWLGWPRDRIDPMFYKEIELDIHFLEPCSPVDIAYPQDGWVVTPAGGDVLTVSLFDYDKADPDLELIRVQYRRQGGAGNWINITAIPVALLGDVFTNVAWNTGGLSDGFYEIRAISKCYGSSLSPGISHIIEGRIERSPPEIFGIPEPADGVLSLGDEISIRFNETILCQSVMPADILGNNNVGLYHEQTGELVPATIGCSDDKIVVVPDLPNAFIENQILRVEVDSVQDLAGNKFGHADWSFYVNRNVLRWSGNDIREVAYEGDALTVVREIENIGGAVAAYSLDQVPAWLEVFPLQGTLSPGTSQAVVFKAAADLPRGEYLDTLLLNGAQGDEPLVVQLRKLCKGPLWELDPAAFDYSMNFTLQLDIEGVRSTDEMDRVGAFVDGTLRGWAALEYEADIGEYLAFLTVYSNTVSGEQIEFRIWDADECLLYGEVAESFPFTLDAFVGNPLSPQVLHTNNLVLRKIPLGVGWNWISFNLDAPDKATGHVLASLQHPNGGLIKSQIQFSQYAAGLSQWIGNLTQLGFRSMYQYQSAAADTIDLIGGRIWPDTVSIPVFPGWNWIAYLPNDAHTPNEALASLSPQSNDILKSRTTFAQYVAGIGWIGNLDYLAPPNGYMLKVGTPGVLVYPPDLLPDDPGGSDELPDPAVQARNGTGPWQVDPAPYVHSMNLIALVGPAGNRLADGDAVGAFVEGELRGSGVASWVEPLQAWLLFLTVYSNASDGETVSFRYFDAETGLIHPVIEQLPFSVDGVVGQVEQPFLLTPMEPTAVEAAYSDAWFEVYPNPARHQFMVAFPTRGNEVVTLRISDHMGRLVREFVQNAVPGLNTVHLETAGLVPGSYILSLQTGSGLRTRRVVVQE